MFLRTRKYYAAVFNACANTFLDCFFRTSLGKSFTLTEAKLTEIYVIYTCILTFIAFCDLCQKIIFGITGFMLLGIYILHVQLLYLMMYASVIVGISMSSTCVRM